MASHRVAHQGLEPCDCAAFPGNVVAGQGLAEGRYGIIFTRWNRSHTDPSGTPYPSIRKLLIRIR